ncbi:hypothetical protein GTX14_36220 [Streptomyces sp. SID4944]|nr:hypothetical protein [Streptomyces sp. SID4944]
MDGAAHLRPGAGAGLDGAGARLVGGCCRVGPEHIEELAALLDAGPGPGPAPTERRTPEPDPDGGAGGPGQGSGGPAGSKMPGGDGR